MEQRRIGPWSVGSVGLGCMNFSHAYGTPSSAEQSKAVFDAALDTGVTLFDTAALYGFGANERLIAPWVKQQRNRITLASKCGMAGVVGEDGTIRRVIDGRPASLRQNCEDSLRRLGTDVIDLYYLHRWDQQVPIEESVGEMGRLVQEGKVRALGRVWMLCVARMPSTRSRPCKASILCGRAMPSWAHCKPAKTWVLPMWPSAQWAAGS